MRKPKLLQAYALGVACFSMAMTTNAQETFPENGVADPRHGHYAFTHATIVKDTATSLKDATLIIKDGKIVAVGAGLKIPAGAVEVDCKGKYIYPSFIDIYADYGMPAQQTTAGPGGFGGGNFTSK